MFDLKFYKLVKLLGEWHDRINNYANYKNCQTRCDMMNVCQNFYIDNHIDIETGNEIYKYNALSYLYFNDYDGTKYQKKLQQVRNNHHNFNKEKYNVL